MGTQSAIVRALDAPTAPLIDDSYNQAILHAPSATTMSGLLTQTTFDGKRSSSFLCISLTWLEPPTMMTCGDVWVSVRNPTGKRSGLYADVLSVQWKHGTLKNNENMQLRYALVGYEETARSPTFCRSPRLNCDFGCFSALVIASSTTSMHRSRISSTASSKSLSVTSDRRLTQPPPSILQKSSTSTKYVTNPFCNCSFAVLHACLSCPSLAGVGATRCVGAEDSKSFNTCR